MLDGRSCRNGQLQAPFRSNQIHYAAWMLPPEAIEEFKILYQERFGEQVRDQEAAVMAEKLLDLFRAVYRKNRPAGTLTGGTRFPFRDDQRPDLVA